jgi:hypothetical protein
MSGADWRTHQRDRQEIPVAAGHRLRPALRGSREKSGGVGVADRCRFIGGSFSSRSRRRDAIIMKYIIHDWNDERCVQIQNCHRAEAGSEAAGG